MRERDNAEGQRTVALAAKVSPAINMEVLKTVRMIRDSSCMDSRSKYTKSDLVNDAIVLMLRVGADRTLYERLLMAIDEHKRS